MWLSLRMSFVIAAREAQELGEKGTHVFIDVRPKARFENGRIPNAVSVPLYQKVRGQTFTNEILFAL